MGDYEASIFDSDDIHAVALQIDCPERSDLSFRHADVSRGSRTLPGRHSRGRHAHDCRETAVDGPASVAVDEPRLINASLNAMTDVSNVQQPGSGSWHIPWRGRTAGRKAASPAERGPADLARIAITIGDSDRMEAAWQPERRRDGGSTGVAVSGSRASPGGAGLRASPFPWLFRTSFAPWRDRRRRPGRRGRRERWDHRSSPSPPLRRRRRHWRHAGTGCAR